MKITTRQAMAEEGDSKARGLEETPEPEEIEFFPLRGMGPLWVAGSLSLAAFATWAAIRGPSGDSALEIMVGRVLFGVVAVFGWSVTARVLARLRETGPTLVLNASGIIDRTALGPPVIVPWDAVLAIRQGTGPQGSLEIRLRDPSALRLPWTRKLAVRMIRRTRDADLVIPVRGLDQPSDFVIAMAHAWNEMQMLRDAHDQPESPALPTSEKELPAPPLESAGEST